MGYYIEDTTTGEQLPATIGRLSREEVMLVNESKKFDFDWNTQVQDEVYALRKDDSDEIMGLMSLRSRAKECIIEVRLLENIRGQIGLRKRYDRVAGSLLAFACDRSLKAGFDAYVCLKPKTHLINHYRCTYGFQYTGLYMISDTQNSLTLINKYYG